MLPGYTGEHYFSPVRVIEIIPRKQGRNLLQLKFYNAGYAESVRDFDVELRVMLRAREYLFAIIEETHSDLNIRSVVISPTNINWLKRHCPGLMELDPPENHEGRQELCQEYLQRLMREERL